MNTRAWAYNLFIIYGRAHNLFNYGRTVQLHLPGLEGFGEKGIFAGI